MSRNKIGLSRNDFEPIRIKQNPKSFSVWCENRFWNDSEYLWSEKKGEKIQNKIYYFEKYAQKKFWISFDENRLKDNPTYSCSIRNFYPKLQSEWIWIILTWDSLGLFRIGNFHWVYLDESGLSRNKIGLSRIDFEPIRIKQDPKSFSDWCENRFWNDLKHLWSKRKKAKKFTVKYTILKNMRRKSFESRLMKIG